MGLFSFIKNAGAKIFGTKKPEQTATLAGPSEMELEAQKAVELEDLINSLGLGINDLYVQVIGDVVVISGSTNSLADKEKAILAVGNVEGVAQVDDRIELVSDDNESGTVDGSQFHTVVSGDTLSKIAKHYYDDAMKYPAIFEANQPMLKSPDLIYPGQVLRIPSIVA